MSIHFDLFMGDALSGIVHSSINFKADHVAPLLCPLSNHLGIVRLVDSHSTSQSVAVAQIYIKDEMIRHLSQRDVEIGSSSPPSRSVH